MTCDNNRIKLYFSLVLLFGIAGYLLTYNRQQKAGRGHDEYCYTLDPESLAFLHVGAVRPYRFVQPIEEDLQYDVPTVKTWMVIRHGIRLPSKKMQQAFAALGSLRDNITKNHKELLSAPKSGRLCAEDLVQLKQWRWDTDITENHEKFLTQEGAYEMKSLAIRFQRAMPNIFEKKFDKKKFEFRFSDTERISESYMSFADGLFGDNASQNMGIQPLNENSLLLNPFISCISWQKSVDSTFTEIAEIDKSPYFTQLEHDVSIRLGFERPLTPEQIFDMYDMCRFGFALETQNFSPWCAAFTPTQLKILEYRDDVEYYYDHGHGQPESADLPCHIISDMVKHLESEDMPKVVANFYHSTAIRVLFAALNLGNDTVPITADNYHSKADRKWRAGELFPSGGNFAAIKYYCPKTASKYKMRFFLHEKPVDLSWCTGNLCDLAEIREHFQRFLRGNCDLVYCKNATLPAEA